MPSLFDGLPDDACLAYRNLFAPQVRQAEAARAHCEDLWRDFEQFSDRHFRRQFARNLQERWFEMYLLVSLLRSGRDVLPHRDHGPDVGVQLEGRVLWLEAITPSGGEDGHPDAVTQPVYVDACGLPQATHVPTEQITLRVRQALHKKAEKFGKYLRDNVVGVDDLAVVAMNLRNIPHAWRDAENYAIGALYGVGPHYVVLDPGTAEMVGSGRQHRPVISRALRHGESEPRSVNVMPFLDGSCVDVSGVLTSTCDCANLPTQLGDDFTMYPNLSSRLKLPVGLIGLGQEMVAVDGEEGTELRRQRYVV